MIKTIAIAGKGGTGKTTVAALLIKYLVENRLGTVLAIDADPSTNLNLALGVPVYETVGDIREEALQEVQSGSSLGGMSKPDYLDLRIQQSLVEERGFDLLAMGRPEGPGCYCAANNMLRLSIDRLSKSYDYVVIDNEAGLEHLSRRTTRDVDLLLTVSDPTMRGIIAAGRTAKLIEELDTRVGDIWLIVNRVPGDGSGELKLAPELEQAIAENGLQLAGLIPEDPTVGEYDAKGLPLIELPPEAPVRRAVEEIIKSLDGFL
ncbi:MAG: carbon monoxide dehydrogenase [Chloroflexi bacterium]|nr:carbon monoxide dehydrogenase [Chloroflexota bacterium]